MAKHMLYMFSKDIFAHCVQRTQEGGGGILIPCYTGHLALYETTLPTYADYAA